jgi:hypothetical protein
MYIKNTETKQRNDTIALLPIFKSFVLITPFLLPLPTSLSQSSSVYVVYPFPVGDSFVNGGRSTTNLTHHLFETFLTKCIGCLLISLMEKGGGAGELGEDNTT